MRPYATLFASAAFAAGLLAVSTNSLADGKDQATPAGEQRSAYQLRIPAAPLAEALNQFGVQTGFQVSYKPELVMGLQSKEVKGKLTLDSALDALLKGTGLVWSRAGGNTVVVKKASDVPVAMVAVGGKDAVAREPGGAEKTPVEQMVVEGEREKRQPLSDANVDIPRTMEDVQPYYIFDSATIERSGAVTVEDFIKQRITMNTVALSNSQGSGWGSAQNGTYTSDGTGLDQTKVDLRGLGANLTLVLINGRRADDRAQGSYGQRLNEIPPSMIDRIEVLPTSASGIYGGNALGGVINIVLKRDFTGGMVSVNYDASQKGSDEKHGASASYGWALEGGRTRINTILNWSDAKPGVLRDQAHLYYESVAQIMANYPAFNLTNTFDPNAPEGYLVLGSLVNIRPNAISVPNLTFLDGTPLGSRTTHIPVGISASTSAADLQAALIANRGTWNTELPNTAQVNGLRRVLNAAQVNRSIGVSVQRQMFPWLDMVLDLRYNEAETHSFFPPPSSVTVWGVLSRLSPVCLFIPTLPQCLNPPVPSPFNPFQQELQVALPIQYDTPLERASDTFAGSLTAEVQLPFNWSAMLDYAHSRSNSKGRATAFDNTYLTRQISAGVLNPFVDPATLAGHDWAQYTYTDRQDVESMADQFAVQLGGPLVKLPWGTPRLNVRLERNISTALEYTRYFPVRPSDAVPRVPRLNEERQTINSSAYAETLLPLVREGTIPILHALELQLAGRADRSVRDSEDGTQSVSYSSRNHTLGFRYQPISQLTLRASRGTAFLPPTIDQLTPPDAAAAPSFSFGLIDPTGVGTAPQVQVTSGGNADLRPQNSESLNVGAIFEPSGWLNGLRMNVEYYKIDQHDAIGSLSPQDIINNEQYFPGRVARDPATGQIVLVDGTQLNLYLRSTEGMDYLLSYNRQLPAGFLGISGSHTTIRSLLTQYTLNQPMVDAAGHPHDGGAAKHKSNLNLTWAPGSWTFNWSATRFGSYYVWGATNGPSYTRYISGQYGQIPPNPAVVLYPQGSSTVPAQIFHDLTIGYRTGDRDSATGLAGIFQGMSLNLGVRNVFATEPKLDVYYGSNYYRSPYGDARLRSFWFNAQKSF